MAKPGRNDLCHCGSGRKYKKCHGPKEGQSDARSRFLLIVVGGGIIAAVAIGIAQFSGAGSSQAGTRTWDPAHGHYHDANGFEIP